MILGSGSGAVITLVGGELFLLRERNSLKVVVTFGADPEVDDSVEVCLFWVSMQRFLISKDLDGASDSGVNAISQSKRSGLAELAGRVLTFGQAYDGIGGKGRGGGGGGGESGLWGT